MGEADERRRSKLHAIEGYVEEARAAYAHDDLYGWRQAMEHLMDVVGSEVAIHGGVVPTYKKPTYRRSDVFRVPPLPVVR